ncbi:hypothetical protein [Spartinivicinus marinus]|nr:hypothetical protein [Spartinivicinus marinus]MCX4025151.1 hypothetical protein [Spartinivicinus marinus]
MNKRFVKLIKPLTKLKSWKKFTLFLPLILLALWFKLVYFKDDIVEIKKIKYSEKDLVRECNSVQKGMSVNRVDNLVMSHNKRLVAIDVNNTRVKYWIANDEMDHLPKGQICNVLFDNNGKAISSKMIIF